MRNDDPLVTELVDRMVAKTRKWFVIAGMLGYAMGYVTSWLTFR